MLTPFKLELDTTGDFHSEVMMFQLDALGKATRYEREYGIYPAIEANINRFLPLLPDSRRQAALFGSVAAIKCFRNDYCDSSATLLQALDAFASRDFTEHFNPRAYNPTQIALAVIRSQPSLERLGGALSRHVLSNGEPLGYASVLGLGFTAWQLAEVFPYDTYIQEGISDLELHVNQDPQSPDF